MATNDFIDSENNVGQELTTLGKDLVTVHNCVEFFRATTRLIERTQRLIFAQNGKVENDQFPIQISQLKIERPMFTF